MLFVNAEEVVLMDIGPEVEEGEAPAPLEIPAELPEPDSVPAEPAAPAELPAPA